jgi:hypothetical protein
LVVGFIKCRDYATHKNSCFNQGQDYFYPVRRSLF